MDSFAVGIVLVISAIFAVAGVAKLFDLKGSRQAVSDFGVPPRFVRAVGLLLPLTELAIAVALLIHPVARVAAVAAAALLLVFIAGVAYAMRRGKDVDCGCFGRIYSATAGSLTLVRNGVLAALALVVVVRGPGPALDAWIGDRTAAELVAIALGTAAVILALVLVLMWHDLKKAHGELAERTTQLSEAQEAVTPKPAGLPLGSAAPEFSLPDRHGHPRTLGSLLERDRPLVLVFTSPTCGPSNKMVRDLARWQSALSEEVAIAVIASGSHSANAELWEDHPETTILLDPDDEVADAYSIAATPVALPLHPDGRVAGMPFGGNHGVEMVIRLAKWRAYGQSEIRTPESSAMRISHVQPSAA